VLNLDNNFKAISHAETVSPQRSLSRYERLVSGLKVGLNSYLSRLFINRTDLQSANTWKSVSMDFVGGLPMTKGGHDYLYVVVDRFNKMCILMPCKKHITAEKTNNLFFQYVWVQFGLTTSIF
jgi:hypothetical protein